jgi:DNA-binding transcriptional regulator YhcF (GntR family)
MERQIQKGLTKQQQISNNILRMIEKGELQRDSRLPSINEMRERYDVSRDTVILAYKDLQNRGIVRAWHGKGYFISSTDLNQGLKIFALFDVMNSYKEILYRSLIENLGPTCMIDIYFHYYNLGIFEKLILENLNNFGYFVIMPHFNQDISGIVAAIPPERLMLIDKNIPKLNGNYSAVYQNFESDIYNGLNAGLSLINKYESLKMCTNHQFQFIPDGAITGFQKFCTKFQINGSFIDKIENSTVKENDAFIVFSDSDLVELIKISHQKHLKLGVNLGIISYDDTPLKEVLEGGITVISTDFVEMGKIAASLIIDRSIAHIENHSSFIARKTL